MSNSGRNFAKMLDIVRDAMATETHRSATEAEVRRQRDFLHGAYVNLVRVLAEGGELDPFTASILLGAATDALQDPANITAHEPGSDDYLSMVAGLNAEEFAAAKAYLAAREAFRNN